MKLGAVGRVVVCRYHDRVGEVEGWTTDGVVERLQAARDPGSPLEIEQALARLESALFGAPRRARVLDRYPLIRELGRGASGVVYLAYDPRLDRKVAIKLLTGSAITAAESSEGRARLLREAQAMARSPHPNIVAVYDVGTYPVDPEGEIGVFMVMEYAEGPDLQSWLVPARPWREVVDVFVAAGRGLAAAHRVGVTHRDFKPVNVVVGVDGRVRVLDFGLARGRRPSEDEITGSGDEAFAERTGLDAPLTVEGAVLGTPAYMAPEQHQGRQATPASDQFSFCVALWEGLHGVRPFQGNTLSALAAAKLAHAPQRGDRSVPGWLEHIVLRGLSPAPGDRWPSMDALLDAIEIAVSRQRLRRRSAVALAGLVPLMVGGWAIWERDTALCGGSSEQLSTVWSDERRAALEEAFAATGAAYAVRSAEHVVERLDRFEQDWVAQHQDACEATNLRGEQSAELMDLRMRCLDRQAREVDALVDVLSETDGDAVERSIEAVSRLPRPEACANREALLAAVEPPVDLATARAVDQLRRDLDRVRALERVGDVRAGLEASRHAAARATELGYRPAMAEALRQRGALEELSGLYAEAAETLAQAHADAVAVAHDEEAARAAELLVFVVGARRGELDHALEWARIAQAELERAGLSDDDSRLLASLGQAYRVAGKFDEARRHTLDAIASLERRVPHDDPLVAMYRNNLGDILRELGDFEGAKTELGRALDIWRRSYGEDHPKVAMPLNNLASVHLQLGEYDRAEAHYRAALAIRERSLGVDHPMVATTLANLAAVLRRTERYDEARSAMERALTITRNRLGDDDVRLAGMVQGLGLLAADEGDHVQALQYVDQAVALWEKHLPPDHPDLGRGFQNRAIRRLHVGDAEGAWSDLARSVAIYEKAFGPGDDNVGRARYLFARTLRETGDPVAAVRVSMVALESLDEGADQELRAALEKLVRDLNGGAPSP